MKGGSPFTDSWFEMPFWILLLLVSIIGILIWKFGVFNKPLPPISSSGKIVLNSGHIEEPTLDIKDVLYNASSNSVKVEYSTNDSCPQCKVLLRAMRPDGVTHNFKSFPIGKHKVELHLDHKPLSLNVQGYISLDHNSMTPLVEKVVIIPQERKHK
jgi:hypothetical protein